MNCNFKQEMIIASEMRCCCLQYHLIIKNLKIFKNTR